MEHDKIEVIAGGRVTVVKISAAGKTEEAEYYGGTPRSIAADIAQLCERYEGADVIVKCSAELVVELEMLGVEVIVVAEEAEEAKAVE